MNGVVYPPGVPHRPARPRDPNGLAGMTIGAIFGLLGGAPLSLEAAIRSYFSSRGLPVIGFYRLGPRAAQVLFRNREQYWTVTSRAPVAQDWALEALDDWLYGDIVEVQLPAKLSEIDLFLT